VTVDELRDAHIDEVGRKLTDLIRKCRDPREVDGLLVAKDRLNRMKARTGYCGPHAEDWSDHAATAALSLIREILPEPPEGSPQSLPAAGR